MNESGYELGEAGSAVQAAATSGLAFTACILQASLMSDQQSVALQGMVLGARALVSAGAESIMILYTGHQHTFTPQRSSTGELENGAELEEFVKKVEERGEPLHQP